MDESLGFNWMMKRFHLRGMYVSRDFHDGVYLFQVGVFFFTRRESLWTTQQKITNRYSSQKECNKQQEKEVDKIRHDDERGWPISRASMSPSRYTRHDGSSSLVILTVIKKKR